MPTKQNHIVDIQKYFLIGILILLLITLSLFIAPFMGTLLIAGVIVTGVYPVHKMLNKKIHIPPTFSALLSLILAAVIIIAPLVALFFFVSEEAADAYDTISIKVSSLIKSDISLIPSLLQNSFLKEWIDRLTAFAPISTADIISTVGDFVGKISSFLLGQTTNILKNLTVFLIHIVVFFLAMFYFLRDGRKLITKVKELMPLPEMHRNALFKKLSALSYGIIYGIFGAAIVQGMLVGLGFAIVGISNAVFWGAIAAILSPIPYIGTAVVWVPVVIALMVSGQFWPGVFLFIWGALIVGMADNIVKPYLIGSSTALHPLAVLLVLLGGAFAFGIKGLLFGPFILTLTIAFLHIYSLEYRTVLHKGIKPHVVLKKKKIK